MTVDPMGPVFRALSDPSRRLLLDRLFERDGQTLGELCAHLPEMTRFGVMRHLDVLEAAGVVVTQRSGREKRHYLNPVPIRLLPHRWISKFPEPPRAGLAGHHRWRPDRALLLRHPCPVELGTRGTARLPLSRRDHRSRRPGP